MAMTIHNADIENQIERHRTLHPMRPSKAQLIEAILRRALQMDPLELTQWLHETDLKQESVASPTTS